MDIKCQKCGTEYELDDARIPPTGLSVKCTTCGNIFKAVKHVEPPRKTMMLFGSQPPAMQMAWQIRKPDGTTFGFNDLTALRRLIQEGKVVETDEISRQGEGWRRISGIPEFAGFFIVKAVSAPPMVTPSVPPVQPAVQVPAPTPVQSQRPAPQPAPAQVPSPVPAPVPAQAPAAVGSEIPFDERPTTVQEQAPILVEQPRAAAREEPVKKEPEKKEPEKPAVVGKMRPKDEPAKAPSKAASKPPDKAPHVTTAERREREFEHLSTDEIDVYGRRKRSRKGFVIALVVLLVLAAGGVAALRQFMPQTFSEIFGGNPMLTKGQEMMLDKAGTDIANGDYAAFKLVADGLSALGEGEKINPAAGSMLVLAHLQWAEMARFEALDLRPRIEEAIAQDPSGASAKKLNDEMGLRADESTSHLEAANRLLKKLMRDNPDDAGISNLMAYYVIVNSAGEKAMLDKAGQFLKEPQDPGMKGLYKFIRAGWLLRNNPNSEEGMKLMKEFMTGDRMKVYPGYLLARAMIQSKRPLAAKDAIEEALRKNPSHPVLKAMLAGLTTVPELPKKPDAQPDGGTAGDGGAPDAGAVEQKAPAEKAAEKPAEKVAEKAVEKAADKAPPAAQKPDQPSGNLENLLKRGRRLRETGRAKQAVEYFEKAADLDPARAEPHTGLGWCYVEQEKFDQAIAEFQKALGLKGSRCESLSGLGETFRYKKNKTEAIRYYQMYLQECPNGPDAPVARNNINNLR